MGSALTHQVREAEDASFLANLVIDTLVGRGTGAGMRGSKHAGVCPWMGHHLHT